MAKKKKENSGNEERKIKYSIYGKKTKFYTAPNKVRLCSQGQLGTPEPLSKAHLESFQTRKGEKAEVTSDVHCVPAQTECGHHHCQTPQPVHLVGSHQAACDQLSSTRFEPAKQQQNTHVATVSMATPLVCRSHHEIGRAHV